MKKNFLYPNFRAIVLLLAGLSMTSSAFAQIITTYAGNNGRCYGGDGGTATDAQLYPQSNILFDGSGNLYFADSWNIRIRKISTTGIIKTIVGNGVYGFSGDGGDATAAQIAVVKGIALDGTGNLYFADPANNRIRKVAPTGIISTIAGNGGSGFSGDGGAATDAELNYPYSIVLDRGNNIYICDMDNSRIRKISTSGVISTIAGNDTAGFSGDGGPATNAKLNHPNYIDIDTSGNIFIADVDNYRIRKLSTTGIITTIAGNGTYGGAGDGVPATSIGLNPLSGLVVDKQGNIFLSEGNNKMRKIDTGGIIKSIAGTGFEGFNGDGIVATAAKLFWPGGIGVDSNGYIYVSDMNNYRIRKINGSGIISTIAGGGTAGLGDGGAASDAEIFGGQYEIIAIDTSGNLLVPDIYNNRIRKITPGGIITTVAGNGTYNYSGDGGQATAAQLAYPVAVTIDRTGNLFIADQNNFRIRKVSTTGIISTVAGNGGYGTVSGDGGPAIAAQLGYITGIVIDGSGNLYMCDNSRVRKVIPSGTISTIAGNGTTGFSGDSGPATAAELNYPAGLAFDAHGNLFIADDNNHRIRMIATSGIITTVLGDGTGGFSGDGGAATSAELYRPNHINFDSSGNIYISDQLNSRIRKVSTTGIITTIAGDGIAMYTGDGGPATNAGIPFPSSTVLDHIGNIYIADYSAIRKVSTCTPTSAPILGDSLICAGSTISLTDTASGGIWSSTTTLVATVDSSGVVLGLSAGTDTIFYSKTDICGTVVQSDIITVNPLPNAGTITGTADSVCPGHTISLTDAVTGGSWLSSNTGIATVSAGIVTGLAAGSTTIKYIVTNPCGADTASFSVIIPDHAYCNMGVNSAIQQYDNLSIYPNPNKGSFTISLTSGSSEGANVIITNMLGQKVKELMLKNNQPTEVQLVVPGGVYFVSVASGDSQFFSKIFVEK